MPPVSSSTLKPFTLQVISIVKSIPAGRVMTYGQVAALAGSPRGARQVVRILHSMSGSYNLPWHRVVNIKGQIAVADEESRFMQKFYLEQEGVVVDAHDRIDLKRFRCQTEG